MRTLFDTQSLKIIRRGCRAIGTERVTGECGLMEEIEVGSILLRSVRGGGLFLDIPLLRPARSWPNA